jgi:uncharacterized protein (TIGR02284 family)
LFQACAGNPNDKSLSFIGDAHRGWADLKATISGKSDEAILDELERAEDYAFKFYDSAREKMAKVVASSVGAAQTLMEREVEMTSYSQDRIRALRAQD